MQNQKDYEKLKENIFDLMCGQIIGISDSIGITDEFGAGQYCDQISQQLYEHITRISENPESSTEIEKVQSLHYELLRHLCLKMYDYGWYLAFNRLSQ